MKHVRVKGPLGTAALMALAASAAFTVPAFASRATVAPGAEGGALASNASSGQASTAQSATTRAQKTRKPKESKPPKVKRAPYVHKPEAGAWDKGATWVTLRLGFADALYGQSGPGSVGAGFGFSRMLSRQWALSGMAERNTVGQFGEARESEIPFTIELDRHINMGPTFRPYFGFGGGTFYHKFSGTGADRSDVMGAGLVAIGGNIVVSPHSMVGLDLRMAFVSALGGTLPPDPVFGEQPATGAHLGLKATWSITY
ncbi:MAG: hypothetical protein HYR73_01105 [Candidatus Eisenbacteria bacterium]|nr:hypothetical protein [Candidatus Eisenbacteria bacterium]